MLFGFNPPLQKENFTLRMKSGKIQQIFQVGVKKRLSVILEQKCGNSEKMLK